MLLNQTSLTDKRPTELLAPAKNATIAIEAVKHGADAVYMGASSHGARSAASNSIAEVAAAVEFAHQFRAKVYVTVNTLIYENELKKVERLISDLYKAGVDALIVQDLGVLRLDIPPIALHASTQCDIRTPEAARFLQDLGFSQLVLPRELTLDEIRAMKAATNVPLEAFVHGALCVSYSGDCYASLMHTGRSANRGECAQLCRLPYDLTDADSRILSTGKHLLSLRDLNRLNDLSTMIEAGISSFKIEGRLKEMPYVKNVVTAYNAELTRLGVPRTSDGISEARFVADVSKSFNRGFTSYFLHTHSPKSIASVDSPKSIGHPIATVKAVKGRQIEMDRCREVLHNGDGLTYFLKSGAVSGLRVNRVDSATSFSLNESPKGLAEGSTLYRNFDKEFDDTLSGETATRYIPLDITVRRAGPLLCMDASGVTVTIEYPDIQTARTPQHEARSRTIGKLGNTIYRLRTLDDRLDDEFVAASALTDLRRKLTDKLAEANRATYPYDYRKAEQRAATAPSSELSYHANVANSLAKTVYRSHGVNGDIDDAPEVCKPNGEVCVMHTRYCLRRELGHCLLSPAGREWKEPLRLTAPGIEFTLQFDCRNCRMKVMMYHQSR